MTYITETDIFHLPLFSSDFSIKVVNKEGGSQKSLNGHEAPILCVVFSPDDEFLVC